LGYKKVYGIAGSEEKCKVAERLGCKACINYKNFYNGEKIRAKDFEKAVKEMMGG
jgi:NADPH-dependent curcumin reductase CurA